MIKIIPILVAISGSSINLEPSLAGKPDFSWKTSFDPSLKSSIVPHFSIPSIVSLPPAVSMSFNKTSRSASSSSDAISSSISSSSNIQSSSSSLLSSSSSIISSSSSSSSKTSSSSISSSSSTNSSSSSSYVPTPDSVGDYLFCDEYGPFSLDNPFDIDAAFTYELHSISSQTIIERMRLFKNGTVVSAASKPSFSYTNGQRKTVSFTIPISDYLTDSGLQLRFEILNSSRTILKAYAASFYPLEKQTISGYSLKHDLYTSSSVGFYGDGSGLHELKDIFDFTCIGDYVDNDNYYRLDISKNTFNYWGSSTLPYQSVKLRFNDDEYLFPNMYHDDNDDIVLPLKLSQNDSTVSFKYKNQFYVNKKTLDTSDAYKAEYVPTSDFYLPINGLAKFNDKNIYLDFEHVGVSDISTTIPLKYDMNRTIVGVCADGDYCVVGGNH